MHFPRSLLTPLPLLLAGLVACGGGEEEPNKPIGPKISEFSADPMMLAPGGTTTLKYTVTGATKVKIDTSDGLSVLPESGQLSGSIVTPALAQTTTFVLSAQSGSGTPVTREITVTVMGVQPGMPMVVSFGPNPATIDPGATSLLSWVTTNATAGRIEGAGTVVYTIPTEQLSAGSFAVMPTVTTAYTLVLSNAANQEARGMATVTVNPPAGPVIGSFAATPDTITQGQNSSLAWSVTGATGITITDAAGGVVYTGANATGTQAVTPATTTTYTLSATGNGQTATAMATITVNPATTAVVTAFAATPANINVGQQSSLDWQVVNAPGGITISDGTATVHTSAQASGSFVVTPGVTTTYTLTAINPAGDATATAVVTVTPGNGATVLGFTATPTSINTGGTSSLSWNVSNAPGGITISDGVATITTSNQTTGTFAVTPVATTTYTLTAINPAGNATANVTVTVNAVNGAQVVSFTATPTSINAGGTASLAWNVTNAPGGITITANAQNVTTSAQATGTFAVTPAVTTIYTLTAINPAGNATANVTVTVNAVNGAQVVSFTATPSTIATGGTASLAWNVTNAPGGITITAGVQNVTTSAQATGTFAVTPAATTTYTLTAINPAGNATANVTVTVQGVAGTETEPNNTLGTANSLPAGGGVINGSITPATDADWFAVTVPAGGNIRAQTTDGAAGCNLDTVIFLYDGSLRLITADDESGTVPCSLIDPTVDPRAGDLAAGTYYLQVVSYQGGATGNYQLQVTVGSPSCGNSIVEANGPTAELCDDGGVAANDGCSATCQLEINPTIVTAPGGNVTLNLNQPGSIAVVQVTIAAGQTITAVAADPGGTTCNNADTGINLGNSTFGLIGQKLDGGPGNCAAVVDPEAPANGQFGDLPAGTYYLVVFNQTGVAATGPVELRIQIRNAACGNNQVEINGGEQCDNAAGVGQIPCTACQITPAGTITLPAGTPQSVTGDFVAQDFDLIRMVVTQETLIDAQIFSPNQAGGCPTADTVLGLFDSNLAALSYDDDTGVGACSQLASSRPAMRLRAGTYYFAVFEATDAALAAYQLVVSSAAVPANPPILEVEPNDFQANATSSGLTGVGTRTLQGVTTAGGDNDVYSFTVPANTTVTVSARTYDLAGMPTSCPVESDPFDTRIFLEAPGVEADEPNTVELEYNDDISATQYCSAITGVQVQGGLTPTTFYVRVQGYRPASGTVGAHEYFLDITVQ
jgi:cysteine-rich repeat protein